jgi:chemotaxis protein CheD
MEQIIVGVAECRIADSAGQVLTTYALGSCIALAVYDPASRVGGLVHYMLPDSALETRRRNNPYVFADTAIPLLLDGVAGRGANVRRLRAYAAGGACMMGAGPWFEIGRRNVEALDRTLARAGLTLDDARIGGGVSRNLRLSIGTGRVRIWESGGVPHGK